MIYDIDYWMPLYHIYSTCNYLESPHLIEKSGREMSLRMIIWLKKRNQRARPVANTKTIGIEKQHNNNTMRPALHRQRGISSLRTCLKMLFGNTSQIGTEGPEHRIVC